MASCGFCGSWILFGGAREGEERFCNDECRRKGLIGNLADEIPEEIIGRHVDEVHQGECPECGGEGPVDVHTSHMVWSALVLTSWYSKPKVCCRSCGVKAKLIGTALSGVLGWWGFPWGIIVTPIQICRNLGGLLSAPDPETPSEQLENLVKLQLAERIAVRRQAKRRRPADDDDFEEPDEE